MKAADPLVILVAPKTGAANVRIAGMAVAARIAAQAAAAGEREFWIVSDGPPSLSAATREDFARSCGSLEIVALTAEQAQARLGEQAGRPLLLLSATHLVPATSYPRLQAEGVLAASGKIVAATAIAGETLPVLGSPAAGESDSVPLFDRTAATRRIVRGTAKPSDGIVSRHLNRPLSQPLSSFLLLNFDFIRPWHMTLVTAAVTLAMFLCLLAGGAGGLIAGGLLFHAASVLDGVDGEIARASFRSSVGGAIFDTAVDMAGNLLFILGLTIGLTRLYGVHYAHLGAWSLAAAVTGLVSLFALTLRLGEHGNFNILKEYYATRFPTGFPAQVRQTLTRVLSRDFFAFGSAVLTVIGWPGLDLWGFAGFMTLWVVLIFAAAPAILRRSAAIPPRASPATT